MRKSRCLTWLAAAGLLLFMASAAQAAMTYTPVGFPTFYNDRITNRPGGFPEGMGLTLGGIPFNIPPGQNNIWWSGAYPNGLISINIPVNIFGVREVHTLINTGWGKTGGPYTWLEFYGTNGAYYRKDLYGDSDIRGWQQDSTYWTTNNISLPTVNVWGNGTQRLDKQFITLPEAFADETLLSITMSDSGALDFSRSYLQGLTVGSVPIPGSLWLLGGGLLGLAPALRRHWSRR